MIIYEVPSDTYVTITIYNLNGQIVKQLINDHFQKAGSQLIEWDAASVPSGSYLCKIEGRNFIANRRIILAR